MSQIYSRLPTHPAHELRLLGTMKDETVATIRTLELVLLAGVRASRNGDYWDQYVLLETPGAPAKSIDAG